MIRTDQPAPALRLPLLGGATFDLAQEAPDAFTLVSFYRGLHCPLCKRQIEEDIVPNLDALAAFGIGVVVASMDDAERAAKQAESWGFGPLRVGYAMPEAMARDWGLFMSVPRPGTTHEPALFSEPAMGLIRPDGRVFAWWQQSVPFARPKIADLLGNLQFVLDNDYPARGTAT